MQIQWVENEGRWKTKVSNNWISKVLVLKDKLKWAEEQGNDTITVEKRCAGFRQKVCRGARNACECCCVGFLSGCRSCRSHVQASRTAEWLGRIENHIQASESWLLLKMLRREIEELHTRLMHSLAQVEGCRDRKHELRISARWWRCAK